MLYCILQEFAPSDEELLAHRKDEEWLYCIVYNKSLPHQMRSC